MNVVPDDSDNDINKNVNVKNEDGDVIIIGTLVNIKEGMFSQLGVLIMKVILLLYCQIDYFKNKILYG